jgi:hypothetical protein
MAQHLKDTTGVVLEGSEDETGGQYRRPQETELLDDGDTLLLGEYILKALQRTAVVLQSRSLSNEVRWHVADIVVVEFTVTRA